MLPFHWLLFCCYCSIFCILLDEQERESVQDPYFNLTTTWPNFKPEFRITCWSFYWNPEDWCGQKIAKTAAIWDPYFKLRDQISNQKFAQPAGLLMGNKPTLEWENNKIKSRTSIYVNEVWLHMQFEARVSNSITRSTIS